MALISVYRDDPERTVNSLHNDTAVREFVPGKDLTPTQQFDMDLIVMGRDTDNQNEIAQILRRRRQFRQPPNGLAGQDLPGSRPPSSSGLRRWHSNVTYVEAVLVRRQA